jgi:gas vesicle protein
MSDQGATAQAKDKAQELAGQAQEQAHQAAGQARDQVRSQIDQRSTDAGRRVSNQAGDLRTVGEQLREQGKDQPAKVADQAADRLERVGSWLTESDADRILSDVEDFARKQPWAVMAGGLALGFAASRLLKASSRDRYHGRADGSVARATIPATTGYGDERFTRGQPLTPPAPPAASVPPAPGPPSTPGVA